MHFRLATLCLLSLCLLSHTALYAAAAPRPNILLILGDDVGSEVLECYGGESYRTPRLNALAAEGLRFTHGYVMPVCHPTRVALLTGQYPVRLGHPSWGTFPEEAMSRTLPALLKQAGYATAIAGKWQLELLGDHPDHPRQLGFDQWRLFGWHEGPRYYEPFIWENGRRRPELSDRYGPDLYVEFLIDFISQARDQPFFAFYSMALCHDVTDDLDSPVPTGPNGRYQNYAEMVAAMDVRVGRLLDALAEAGVAEETLIIYLGDNGTPQKIITHVEEGQLVRQPVVSVRDGEPIPGGKTELTDAGTRVPWLVRWPSKITQPRVVDQLVDATDLLPTLVRLAGGQLPSGVTLDGQSFASTVLGQSGDERSWVFAERKGQAFVRDKRWKLYRDGRFYDMQTDPTERNALSSEAVQGEAAASREKLAAAMHDFEVLGLDREVRDRR